MRLLTRPEGLSVFTDKNNTSKVKWGSFLSLETDAERLAAKGEVTCTCMVYSLLILCKILDTKAFATIALPHRTHALPKHSLIPRFYKRLVCAHMQGLRCNTSRHSLANCYPFLVRCLLFCLCVNIKLYVAWIWFHLH